MVDITNPILREQAKPPFFLGIDVGGTGIKLGIVDDNGYTIGRTRIATEQEKGPEDACRRVSDAVASLTAGHDVDFSAIAHVGLATPGTMNIGEGMLLQPHNLPAWWDFPIRDHLGTVLDKPVAFQNDANAAAYGEYWVGSGADYHSMALLTLGTGVGGGIIAGGKLIDGEHSHGSECGHTYIASGPNARMCGCGRRGHLEAYASATAVTQRTQEALDNGRQSSIVSRVSAGEVLTSLMVSEEAEAGDELALEIVMETARYLSYGAVNIMHVIDPDAIVFGGAMNFGGSASALGQRFLEAIRKETHKRAFPALAEVTAIEFAMLGGHAGYIGAAGVARVAYSTG